MQETQTDQVANLEEIQSGAERSRTLEVTERVIAMDGDTPVERAKTAKVFVRPLPFRRWSLAIGYIRQMLQFIPEQVDLTDPMSIGLFAGELLGAADEQVFGLITLATDKDVEFYDRIDLDDGIKILIATVEVNKDFFVQKVLPLLTAEAPNIQQALTETFGQTQ